MALKATRRGAYCKTFEQQRPRRNEFDDYNDAEFSSYKRGKGSVVRLVSIVFFFVSKLFPLTFLLFLSPLQGPQRKGAQDTESC